ncbi:hypothetical protein HZC09_02045 [Candidatus Micrarchaeota archaeon]|nr:hypothetical protein [Candidatus Micrarchaeota archaeon]
MKKEREEVKGQCETLLDLARKTWNEDQTLARRYVRLAFRIAMRHRVHLDPKKFCRKCFAPFTAETFKVRQERRTKTVLYSCRKCNYTRRIPKRKKETAIVASSWKR